MLYIGKACMQYDIFKKAICRASWLLQYVMYIDAWKYVKISKIFEDSKCCKFGGKCFSFYNIFFENVSFQLLNGRYLLFFVNFT